MIIFVARDIRTGKSYKVPELSSSKFDDLQETSLGFHLGLTIKDWSREKSQRDLQKMSPSFEESAVYQDYLQKVNDLKVKEPESVVKMKETEVCTMSLMHGQDRNRHGKMFGGYLMREAFDISYIAAGAQSPHSSVELLRVDQVLFLKPVPIGSVMDLRSKVTLIKKVKGLG